MALKKLRKDVLGFGGVAAGLGVSTAVVSGIGGSTAGLSTMAGFMPLVATVTMAKHVKSKVKKLRY